MKYLGIPNFYRGEEYMKRINQLSIVVFLSAVMVMSLPLSAQTKKGPDFVSKPSVAAQSEPLAVPRGRMFLVPNEISEVKVGKATPIHNYGSESLMVISAPASLPSSILNRLTPVDDTSIIGYRGWKGVVPGLSDIKLAGSGDAYYLVALIGPPDQDWLKQFADFGVKIVDKASPYGFVVHARGDQLLSAALSIATSYGYSVVRGVLPVPIETRLSGELLRFIQGRRTLDGIKGLRRARDGSAVARLFFYGDSLGHKRPLDHRAAQLANMRKYTRKPDSALAYGFDDAVLIRNADELRHILQSIPSVAYVELIHERQTDDHAQVYYPVAMAEAPPLYTVKPIVPKGPVQPKVMPEEEIPSWINGRDNPAPVVPLSAASVVQNWTGKLAAPSPITNFEGLGDGVSGFSLTGVPPDTEGDVGPTYYVQWVNCMFAAFDKSTGSVKYGPANGSTLFQNLGGSCASDNDGDPLVMYDRIANRWFMSQFAIDSSPYYQCVAVSKTSDFLTTGWWTYAYSYGTNFNDYGKGGVWPDGYYMMYHMFANGSSWAGAEVCAFDRVQMLAGNTATQQCFGPNSNYGGLLPSNLQGSTLPPSGSPNYYVAFGSSGQLLYWPFHVDWTTPADSTFPFTSPTTISVAAFTEPCGGSGGTCVPQKGTTEQLDTLGDRLMWRSNYRNFGDHESLVFNHSVDAGAGTGVRWYELRDLSTTPTVYQQGTFAPSDTTWRWMGSIDMDHMGDIALGYSGSSSTLNPSIMYTGRLVTDTLGTLPQGETTLYSGTGSQTSYSRWGDYSTMSIDPVDDCTFWYTQEYLTTDGSFNWHTRIGSFKFPSCTICTTPGVPTIGTVTVPGLNQLQVSWTAGSPAGATYNIYRSTGACPGGTYTQIATGVSASPYTDSTVSGGVTYSYEVTAVDSTGGCESAQSGCASATATGSCITPPTFAGLQSVTAPGNATCELDLSWSAATPNCGTAVVYNIYRSTVSGFTPDSSNMIASCVTGTTYTDTSGLVDGTTYYYIVRAEDNSGYGSGPCASGNEDTNTTEVSGIPTGPLTVPINEDFEEAGGEPTSGGTWSHTAAQGTDDWAQSTSGSPNSPTHTFFCSDVSSLKDDYLVTPSFSVSSGSTLTFWHTYDMENTYDGCVIEITTDGGTSWTDLGPQITTGGYTGTISTSYSSPIAGRSAWTGGTIGTETQVVVDLSSYAGLTAQIRFRLACDTSVNNTGWYIDDVQVSASGSCSTATAVKPVPDGKWVSGTAATAVKIDAAGTSIGLTWDVSTCTNTNYNLYYGNGSTLSAYTLAGSNCAMGTSGSATWTAPAIPSGENFIWWVIVGTDGASTESSWGKDSSGSERNGTNASNQCSFTTKDTSGTCP